METYEVGRMRQVASLLTAARDSIATPDKWLQNRSRAAEGGVVKRCASGAIVDAAKALPYYTADHLRREAQRILAMSINSSVNPISVSGFIGSNMVITSWNDAPVRTHQDVMDMFNTAIDGLYTTINSLTSKSI